MAHECFEDFEVAAEMNRRFVNIKVDREERPEVDAVYMEAVQALTGRGGWPMTVFMDADGRPFFGGTYYPRPTFMELMAAISDAWEHRRSELEENAEALVAAISASAQVIATEGIPPLELINITLEKLGQAFDPQWGGFGSAPKFPQTMHLELICWVHSRTHSPETAEIISTTLDAMASGGMYDHVGGGFARYSTDREWLIPHFEKMLYDQALLARIYLHSWAVFGTDHWRQVVTETIEFVLRDLRHERGGFFCATDADSPVDHSAHAVAVEGAHITWTPEEFVEVLGDRAPAAMQWWGITREGNFEGRSVPHRSTPFTQRGLLTRSPELEQMRSELLSARGQRPPPGLDDKVLTEWNAMMLSTLAEAATFSGRADWLEAAIACGEFLWEELRTASGRWFRSWHASDSRVGSDSTPTGHRAEQRSVQTNRPMATAADHAAVIDAYTRLAEASGQARWIERAREVAEVLLDHFFDPINGGVFTIADDAEHLVARQKDLLDTSTPSANSTAAIALMRLGALTGESRYSQHSDRILALLGSVASQMPTAVSQGLVALGLRHQGLSELVITGHRPDLVEVAHSMWRPDVVLAWGEPYDSPLWSHRQAHLAYLCSGYTCAAPVDTADALGSLLASPVRFEAEITSDRDG
jgi:uncharacterized protein YyaL (SSP411 family)